MALPLPSVVPDRGPGGGIWDIYKNIVGGANALTKGQLENKFLPLETAIKAQNALSYGNRMGNIGMFLRGISQMPSAERQAYLADPANRTNYMHMLETFRTGINNPSASGNILTPEYVASFGLGGDQGGSSAPAPRNALIAPVGNVVAPNEPQEFGANNRATDEEVNDIALHGNNAKGITVNPNGSASIGGNVIGQAVPEIGTGYTPEMAAKNNLPPAPRNEEGTDVSALPALTPGQRSLYSSQLQTNNQRIGTQLKNRADQAIAFDKFLELHRSQIGKVFKDAAKYNQLYGRSKNWLEKFQKDQPEEYANYISAKTSLTPLMANGIRFLEAMGVSHEAQEDAKNQVSQAVDALDVSPDTAIKVFNNHLRALGDVTQGILDSAEPAYPGVRKKLAGLHETPYNFIPMTPKPKTPSVPNGRMLVKDANGNIGTIPVSQWPEAHKLKYTKVKS